MSALKIQGILNSPQKKVERYLSRDSRAVDERCPKGLQALKMIAMDMAEKTGQRRWSIWILSEVINYFSSTSDMKACMTLTSDAGKF